MNRNELISAIATKTNLTKAQTTEFVNACIEVVDETLTKGEDIRLVGFGSFGVKQTKERETRNPRTGEKVTVKASKKPFFKFGKAFADKFAK